MRQSLSRISFGAALTALTFVVAGVVGLMAPAVQAQGQFTLPGVIAPSACRVGGVVSGEQFTTTGFSNVRTANPDGEYVAGFWVVADNYVPDTSVVNAPNCDSGGSTVGDEIDQTGLNLMGVRLKPTMMSAAEADIREVKLVHDVNLNGLYDPLLDLVLQTKSGSELDSQQGAAFFYGPQAPLAVLGNPQTGMATNTVCELARQTPGAVAQIPAGPISPQQNQTAPCAIGLLAVVNVGENPTTGSQFGLELEALSGDIPGAPGTSVAAARESSGFSSSRNPQASNVRLQMVGGTPGSETPISHLSNGSGNPESAVRAINFTGGQSGEGLLTRFRKAEITPGTREAIAIAVGICDGGELANTNASILPSIAGSTPTIAGGPSSIPCVPSEELDDLLIGINGSTLIFDGPLAEYMGTVRMYVDMCSETGFRNELCGLTGDRNLILNPGNFGVNLQTSDFFPQGDLRGGGDGILFQPGELVGQVVPTFNETTGEAVATFGGQQGQILTTNSGPDYSSIGGPDFSNGIPVISGSVAETSTELTATGGSQRPLLIIFTVDIDENAPSGQVDVRLGLQSYDDTAQGQRGICYDTLEEGRRPFPGPAGLGRGGGDPLPEGFSINCGSNFLNEGPAASSFSVEAADGGGGQPSGVAQYDTNNSGVIDDNEFMAAIDDWIAGSIGDALFFDVLDAWVDQTSVSTAGVSGLSLSSVNLSSSANGTTFAVSGQGVESTSVEVFSLDGSQVFAQTSAGSTLTWNHTASSGQSVANGVYLYRVTVEGADGSTVTSRVQKLVVVR